MTLVWHGAARAEEVVNLGPLALIQPLLDQLDIASIIDRHLPPDPQLEFSHGQVLSLLVAARLCQPTALMNVPAWAHKTGADILWNLPADKLNDDRLGRALDAFFEQRHSIFASATAKALQITHSSLEQLHFDTTHVTFCGAYETSQRRPATPLSALRGDAQLPPAHIGHGYINEDLMVQVGLTAMVDNLGGLPVFSQCLDGQRNGRRAIAEQFQLLQQHLPLPTGLLMISDRGTYSADHVARLQRHGSYALCSMRWNDYQTVYDAHVDQLHWQQASYLSIEQRRRRQTNSTLPREQYRIAVLKHNLIDPSTRQPLPGRLIFVHSSANEKFNRERRTLHIAKIKAGLEDLAARVQRGHAHIKPDTIARSINRLFGTRWAARYFHWQLVALTSQEQAALPPPGMGCRPPRHRLEFTFDAAAAETDGRYDGLSVLFTTAPVQHSADELFTKFKEQNYIELLHHQMKTPLAVRPVFLKSPRRVEALVTLLQIALQAYQVLERRYRQTVLEDAPVSEQRMTAEALLRQFRVYGCIVRTEKVGRVVHATRLSSRQRQILNQLSLPAPTEMLRRILHPVPTG
jgi:transposase